MRTDTSRAGNAWVWILVLLAAVVGLWFWARSEVAKPATGKNTPKASTTERIARDVNDFTDYATGGMAIETGKQMKQSIRKIAGDKQTSDQKAKDDLAKP